VSKTSDKYQFNLHDICYELSHEELNPPSRKATYSDNIFVLSISILKIFYKAFASFFYALNPRRFSKFSSCDFLFISFTANNTRALLPVYEITDNSILLTKNNFNMGSAWIYVILHIPRMFIDYFNSSGYLRRAYCSQFYSFCASYGYFRMAMKTLKIISPKFVILANDHSYPQRSFFRAAQVLDIKTVYLQHASVTENFPKLEFDYAFLDGKESFDIYIKKKGYSSMVFLSGSTRFDVIHQFMKSKSINSEIKTIGVAINEEDNKEIIVNFIRKLCPLLVYNNLKIILRPHPSDPFFKYWKEISSQLGILFSNSKEESPFEFIAKNDVFISCESSFHLDAIVSGKPCFYYNFSGKKPLDRYWYIQKNLIKDISSYSDAQLIDFLLEGTCCIDTETIKYFVANYDTIYWGQSARLINQTLVELSEKNNITNMWKKECDENVYNLFA
jgi:hypothetical protein